VAEFDGEDNITTLRGRGPHPWPRPRDVICQTRTLARPRRPIPQSPKTSPQLPKFWLFVGIMGRVHSGR
jgi:hypothetical protein